MLEKKKLILGLCSFPLALLLFLGIRGCNQPEEVVEGGPQIKSGPGGRPAGGVHSVDINEAIASVERLIRNQRHTPEQENALRLILADMKSNAVNAARKPE